MVTCYLRYVIDPSKLAEFRTLRETLDPAGREIRRPPPRLLPALEGANNIALALFTFPAWPPMKRTGISPGRSGMRGGVQAYAEDTRCILSYERSFFRPVFG